MDGVRASPDRGQRWLRPLTAADVKLFRRTWSVPVGGMLTAQPLYVFGTATGSVLAYGDATRTSTAER